MQMIPDRMKLTFKNTCYAVLDSDAFTFGVTISDVIECCCVAYCKESSDKIPKELLDKRSEGKMEDSRDIIRAFSKVLLSEEEIYFRKSLLNLILNKGTSKSLNRRRIKGAVSYIWKVKNRAGMLLYRDKLSDAEGNVFIRDLVEEYAEMPFSKRERIMLADRIESIELAKDVPFEFVSGGGFPVVMHPYAIENDPNLQYTYVIGHGVRASEYDPSTFKPTYENVRNIRILNLQKYPGVGGEWIKRLPNESVFVNEQAILRKKADLPIAFISDEPKTVVVELNAAGEKLYKSIIHNRPRFIKRSNAYKDGFRTYTFTCTIFQAVIYFMNFENNARIVSPPEAVQRIKQRLEKTLGMYQ
ncbi:MAG: hypothetical protein IKM48_04625 [Clostridia bacterium]|nr:hypothetical protein [Clostridia bacterium]